MALNRRLLFWLIKAYVKKWRKTIIIYFFVGLAFFFIFRFLLSSFITKIPLVHQEIIGSVGAFTVNTLPPFVITELSHGLTSVDKNGTVHPDLASSWEVKDTGKAYIFHVKPNITFDDGTPLTSSEIHLSFSDVTIQRPDPWTIVFRLKDVYAPFLVSISRPLFRNGFVGIGKYKIQDLKLNGPFVASLTTAKTDDLLQVKQYQFYPTQESLKIAFVLGNVTKIYGVTDLAFKDTTFASFPNAVIDKQTDYSQLVTLFFNTQDRVLSDKKLRNALTYALPNSFTHGERAFSPISPLSWAYDQTIKKEQDLDHAKLLLAQVADQNNKKLPDLVVFTLPGYEKLATTIALSWRAVGLKTKIKVVNRVPDNLSSYSIFLGNFNVPKDPDQYTLWHSDQLNNITGYKSVRIDKLLEDGRKTQDQAQRVKIYADFQKYLLDDEPAAFLYYPYVYTVSRK